MAIAALQQGVITLDNSTLLCGGGIQIGNKFTRCMGNHGRPDLHTVTPEQDEAVVKAMWSVVNEAGTATGIKKACYDIAAKTGTAQVVEVGKTSAGTKITRGLYPMLLLRT